MYASGCGGSNGSSDYNENFANVIEFVLLRRTLVCLEKLFTCRLLCERVSIVIIKDGVPKKTMLKQQFAFQSDYKRAIMAGLVG